MTPTLANAGVPMLFVVGPVLLLALIPISFVEATMDRWRLGIPWNRAILGSFGANVLSTVVGVPVTWVALVLLQLITGGGGGQGVGIQAVTWQAPWLKPYEAELHWMIPAAGMVLCVPFFCASVFTEYKFLYRYWRQLEPGRIRRAVWFANTSTYACLVVFWGVRLFLSIPR